MSSCQEAASLLGWSPEIAGIASLHDPLKPQTKTVRAQKANTEGMLSAKPSQVRSLAGSAQTDSAQSLSRGGLIRLPDRRGRPGGRCVGPWSWRGGWLSLPFHPLRQFLPAQHGG